MSEELAVGWEQLQNLCRGEYGTSIEQVLASPDKPLLFKRIGPLTAVWLKHPFAQSFEYDPNLPSNWAKALRCWEIHEPPALETIRMHQAQFELLTVIAAEWERPVEIIGEFNIFYSLSKRFRPIVCGESKALENAEKIAKDLRKSGRDVALITPNQLLGAASVTIAGSFVAALPWLSPHTPIVTGVTLLAMCLGQRKLCMLLVDFEKSYDKRKDTFAAGHFPICSCTNTGDRDPCRNRVRTEGMRCWIHA
jgi:hypothetical protein